MSDDGELLRKFAETRDEACFETVVRRYLGFVYAVSLRRLRDPHAAHDATQAVFIALARKAAKVAQAPSVMGWLHRSVCYETRNLMRAQANRIARESEALQLGTASPHPSSDTGALEAVLDDALGQLSDYDRNALLARYFSGHSYSQIGTTLRLTENATRMRVERSLEKLRGHLVRKGITCTAAALGAALPACASTPVVASMASTITTTAVASATVVAGATSIFVIMSTAKIVTGAVIVAAVAGYFYQAHKTSELETTLTALRAEQSATTQKLQSLQHQIGKTSAAEVSLPQQATSASKQSASAIPLPPPPGITPKAPTGWHANGSATELYEVGVDETQQWGGMPSAYAKSIGEADGKFGGMMQTISADSYRNQRVRLTGWIKTEEVTNSGNLWMRVDGENGKTVTFDNMRDRAPKGTTDWEEYYIVLDVPASSSTVNYGFFVSGKGKMWVNGVTLTPVGAETASTDMVAAREKKLPKNPTNLGFSPQHPN